MNSFQWFTSYEDIKPNTNYKVLGGEAMEDLRVQFLRDHRCPNVSLSGPRDIRKLTYIFSSKDKTTGKSIFVRWSKDYKIIEDFYAYLNQHYNLELKHCGENTLH